MKTVFQVGGTQTRFVSRKHVSIWFVEVPLSSESQCQSLGNDVPLTSSDMNASGKSRATIVYHCHLWRHFNGSLNWHGLQTILLRVMTYLMAHPGCSLCLLCHVLNPDVLPATTTYAVDILEEIGCVELIRIQKPAKSTLFSSRRIGLSITDNISLDDSLVVINVLMSAPVKLAYFLDLAVSYCQGKELKDKCGTSTEK